MQILPLRLKPDQDLRESLKNVAQEYQIQAGFIVTAVGSLKTVVLRFANQKESHVLSGRFEIVSLVGTFSIHGLHLHISLSGEDGQTIGGHLQPGSLIYTTAEIVVGISPDFVFRRVPDPQTGYLELDIHPV